MSILCSGLCEFPEMRFIRLELPTLTIYLFERVTEQEQMTE